MRRCVFLRAVMALAVSTLAGACASGGGPGVAVPRPFPVPGNQSRARIPPPARPQPALGDTADGYALVGTALSLRGAPYRNGGTDPRGFDCSGLTQYVFAQHGVSLPREVRDQFQRGTPVKTGKVAAGDLLFFTTVARSTRGTPGPTHVAIAIGGDEFIHAPSSIGVVRIERLSARYWTARYLGARRID